MENYYSLFFQFLDTFKGQNFQDIPPDHPLVVNINGRVLANRQCFHINNMVQLQILYCTPSCELFFGVPVEKINPELYFERTHPEDLALHASGRSRVVKAAMDLYTKKRGMWFLSANIKTRNGKGEYRDLLYQMCLSYKDDPSPAVFGIQVNSDVTDIMQSLSGIHYLVSEDESVFRPPDEELLSIGPGFSARELEILRCISEGLDSEQIAEKLFLSVHTVNTHRRNVLEKSGNRSTHELVIKLQEDGFF
jgi:DNA-binding CsgD family transcriptional regulator